MNKRLVAIVLMLILFLSIVIIKPVSAYNDFYSDNDILFYSQNGKDLNLCGEGSGEATSLIGDNNRDKIWNFLRVSGLSIEQTAGIMGNIQGESGFGTSLQEQSQAWPSGGYGLVQWTGGRRTNIENAIKTELGVDFYNKYYTDDYSFYVNESNGFVAKSSSTGELMPIADSDKLLLFELKFLLQESKARTINTAGKNHAKTGIDYSGMSEWDAISKQDTVKQASDIWLYSFEIPADIDAASITRAGYGEAIKTIYESIDSISTGNCYNGDKQALAAKIMELKASGQITCIGAYCDWVPGIEAIRDGTSNGNDWGVGVNIYILNIIVLAATNHKVDITSINRSLSDPTGTDAHSAGNGSAVDFDSIDGTFFGGAAEAWDSGDIDRVKLILDSTSSIFIEANNASKNGRKSNIGQSNCGSASSIPASLTGVVGSYTDTCHHVHIQVPTDSDVNLINHATY